MKTSITVATFLVVGAGVAGVSALPAQWFGSDTLFSITGAVITATLGAGDVANYVGGGSGGGASAMAKGTTVNAALQVTAPMSRMIKNEGAVCTVAGFQGQTTLGGADGNASGIVVGLDGVDLYSSNSTGASAACNAAPVQSADNTGFGLVYTGTTGVFTGSAATSAQNWKWALALVYGGYDYSQPKGGPQGAPDCGQASRLALVSNWSNMFQQAQAPGTCSNTNAACAASGPTGGALWHAFRRDDTSGTSDVFATILGLPLSTSSSNNNGFGTSPYCNAINWDATNGGAGCNAKIGGAGNLPHDMYTGPGGVPDLLSTQQISGTTGQAHRRPPPGTWGDQPDPGQNKFSSADVLPTQQQDNDPIRRPCLGNGSTNNVNIAGEEVCNIDGALGLVLPMVDTDFMLTLTTPGPLKQFPTNASTTFAANGGRSVAVLNCAPNGTAKHAGECPNGDALNLSVCAVPIDGIAGTSQCVAKKATVGPSILFSRPLCSGHYGTTTAQSFSNGALNSFFTSTATTGSPTLSTACVPNAGAPDGRHYNVQMRDGSITAPGYAGEFIPALGASVDMAGGYNRIHQVETVLGSSSANVGAAAGCQLQDMTDQIACLSQADPCSIGYAGDAGKAIANAGFPNPGASNTGAWTGTTGPLGGFDSLRAAQVYPSAATVQLLGKSGEYQVARKLYFNSLVGYAAIAAAGSSGFTADPTSADELTIAKFEANPTQMNAIVVAQKEFTLGQQFTGDTGANPDPQFCEDFNEQTVCGASGNANGCPGNPSGIPAGAAGVAGSNSGSVGSLQTAGTSTICGDGIRQAYEECDNGTSNGLNATAAGACSLTCRCVFDFNNATGACN